MEQGPGSVNARVEEVDVRPERPGPLLPGAEEPLVAGYGTDSVIADDEQAAAEPEPPKPRPPEHPDDVTAISRLKFRYLRTLDTKSWDEFADTLVPEATATYSEYLQFESREAFLAFLRNTLGPHVITEHRCDHPEIDVDGDTATGTWYLADTVLIPEHNMCLHGAAFYTDRYVRCDDGYWRIAHTGYERTYEVVLSLSDLPSLRLTASRWGMISQEVARVEREPEA
ncbi:SnoaL-like protein [Nocardia caishijiensis]|uniref:SnoaL-like protein n=1 Tax=Nocardia caishijiensis TaxID=184756 RepID=A0ABQ6YSC8_9NOCA|nr:SnoaL-like protein [Nocardia caishijiensis]